MLNSSTDIKSVTIVAQLTNTPLLILAAESRDEYQSVAFQVRLSVSDLSTLYSKAWLHAICQSAQFAKFFYCAISKLLVHNLQISDLNLTLTYP